MLLSLLRRPIRKATIPKVFRFMGLQLHHRLRLLHTNRTPAAIKSRPWTFHRTRPVLRPDTSPLLDRTNNQRRHPRTKLTPRSPVIRRAQVLAPSPDTSLVAPLLTSPLRQVSNTRKPLHNPVTSRLRPCRRTLKAPSPVISLAPVLIRLLRSLNYTLRSDSLAISLPPPPHLLTNPLRPHKRIRRAPSPVINPLHRRTAPNRPPPHRRRINRRRRLHRRINNRKPPRRLTANVPGRSPRRSRRTRKPEPNTTVPKDRVPETATLTNRLATDTTRLRPATSPDPWKSFPFCRSPTSRISATVLTRTGTSVGQR